jgi:hypothetical protein
MKEWTVEEAVAAEVIGTAVLTVMVLTTAIYVGRRVWSRK